MRARIAELGSDRRGGVAMIASIALPMLMLLVGLAVDYGVLQRKGARVQSSVDAAAFAVGRELALGQNKMETAEEVAKSVIASELGEDFPLIVTSIRTRMIDDPLQVVVEAEWSSSSPFGGLLGVGQVDGTKRAVASIVGQPNICVLALSPTQNGAINLLKQARMTGLNCAIFSNSTHANSIKSKNSSMLTASTICSAGGKDGEKGNFTPEPLTDCPQFEDPLAARPEPSIGECDETDLVIEDGMQTLEPGTYCGGLKIRGAARVDLEPGIYVIKDGELLVDDTAELRGQNVGIFLTGAASRLDFTTDTTIELTAPLTGDMAGLLVFGSRSAPAIEPHVINSDNARILVGTIYLPEGKIEVDANEPIANESAYTAIVAQSLSLSSGPHLVLRSDYHLTDVPVPKGLRGVDQPVVLTE